MKHPISRRTALQKLVAGAAAWSGGAAWIRAAASATGGHFIEKQSTGAEIWQVTAEPFDQSNIYGEAPYCSRD